MPPHRAVDHRKQRGGNLPERHAAKQCRGGKSRQITDHTASYADDDGSPVDFGIERGVPDLFDTGDSLVCLIARKLHFDWRFACQGEVTNGICRPRTVVLAIEYEDGIAFRMLIRPNPNAMTRATPDFDAVGPQPQRHDDGRAVSNRHDLRRNFFGIERARIDHGVRFRVRRAASLEDALQVSARIVTKQRTPFALADARCEHRSVGGQRHDDALAKEHLPRVVIDHGPAAKRDNTDVGRKRLQCLLFESPKRVLSTLGKNLWNRPPSKLLNPIVQIERSSP